MPRHVDVTDQCTFNPNTGSTLSTNVNVNVSYNDGIHTLTTNLPINTYPRAQFNEPYRISNLVTNCNNLFADCSNYNQSTVMPDSILSCNNMFKNCTTFNQPITIPNNVMYCDNMFNNCDIFNQSITLSDNVVDAKSLFYNCHNFNQYVKLSNNLTTGYRMFFNCNNFNRSITIPGNITNYYELFNGCYNFNQSVTIGSKVTDCSGMFSKCYNFNRSVTIPNNVINCNSMFNGCINFNQQITIGRNVKYCDNLFRFCQHFNRPITIADNVINCNRMFEYCSRFNQSVTIPGNVYYMTNIFADCDGLKNQTINIHANSIYYKNAEYAFKNCLNHGLNINISGANIWLYNLFGTAYSPQSYTQNTNIIFNDDDWYLLGCENIVNYPQTEVVYETLNDYCEYNDLYKIYIRHPQDGPYILDSIRLNKDPQLRYPRHQGGALYPPTRPDWGDSEFIVTYVRQDGLKTKTKTINFEDPSLSFSPEHQQSIPLIGGMTRDCNVTYTDSNLENINLTFSWYLTNDYEFNYDYNISEYATNCLMLFFNCIIFNKPINIKNNVTNCRGMFYDCKRFNQPIFIPSSVTDCSGMFYGCESLNSRINSPYYMNITNASLMFANCITFNYDGFSSQEFERLIMNATDVSHMFDNCISLDQHFAIFMPGFAENCKIQNYSYMFANCIKLNDYVYLNFYLGPDTVSTAYMFYNCSNLHYDTFRIGPATSRYSLNNLTNTSGMFAGCTNFNGRVNIVGGSGSPNLTNVSRMFQDCTNFNQPVYCVDGAIDCSHTFENCTSLNTYRVYYLENAENCAYMFAGCTKFNELVNINHDRVDNCTHMFYNCTNFNRDITIPNTVNNVHNMFVKSGMNGAMVTLNGFDTYINCYYTNYREMFNILSPGTYNLNIRLNGYVNVTGLLGHYNSKKTIYTYPIYVNIYTGPIQWVYPYRLILEDEVGSGDIQYTHEIINNTHERYYNTIYKINIICNKEIPYNP